MNSVLDWFRRNSGRGQRGGETGPPLPPDYGPFNPFGDFGGPGNDRTAPCIKCGEMKTVNAGLFCLQCWYLAVDLTRFVAEKKKEAAGPGVEISVHVAPWAYILAAHFPRDPGPDPEDPTWPDTMVPVGSYWQPNGPKPGKKDGKTRGVCACHFAQWN